jgi:lysophospholipase L1-like esterase
MKQIYVFGASGAYGVGAEHSGWADLLKQSIHHKMYGEDGIGEKYEVYNFAQPGADVAFVMVTAREQLKYYRRSGETIAVIAVGGNNSKAEDAPDNFVSGIEDYEQLMSRLLERMKEDVDEIVVVGNSTVDEAKTNPKPNPLTGGQSFFTNDRRILFNHALMKLCFKYKVHFVDVDVSSDEWKEKYLYSDGLHPNQAGHQYIFEKVSTEVEKLL